MNGTYENFDRTTSRFACLRLALRILSITLLLGVASAALVAQITVGGVAGTVKDPSGAVIHGARITLTNEATQVMQKTQSTSTGTYVFAAVPVGTYTLRADASGFKTYASTGIQIHIQNTVTIDIPLALGNVNQQVTVTSAVPLLQAQDASLGQTVPSAQVNDLPLSTRNWLNLVNLAAGSYISGTSNPSSIAGTANPSNSGTINVNGVINTQVDFTLNGIDNNNEVFEGVNITPVPDAIQEFKLQDGDNSAQFGQFSGAIINAAIKSGTNKLNGDLWEYLRNEALNANDYFNKQNGTPRQEYRQNIFGGTVGGPVEIPKLYNGRDKTFFFVDYQHYGLLQHAAFTETVPTANMQNSDFQNLQDLINDNSGTATDAIGRTFSHGTVLDPATTRSVASKAIDSISGLTNTTASTVYVRDPFYNCASGGCPSANYGAGGPLTGITNFTGKTSQLNVIPKARLDPNGVALLQLLPPPTTTGLANDYYVTPPAPNYTNQYDVRIDENINPNNLVWGVLSRAVFNGASYQPFPGIAGGENAINPVQVYPHYEIALGYTHVFSSTMENEMTAGYDHDSASQTMPNANVVGIPAEFGIKGIPENPGNGGLTPMEPSGITSFGTRKSMPTVGTDTALQFQDNLMKTHRNHEFNVGFNFNHIRGNILQPQRSKGLFGFTGLYSDIPTKVSSLIGIADMLIAPGATNLVAGANGISNLGGPSSYVGSNYDWTDYFADYYAAYVQDNWRLTSRLTFNLGMRWEYFSPYGENNGREANFIAAGGDGFSSPGSSTVGGTYYIPQKGCGVARSSGFNALLAGYNINVDCVSGLTVNKAQKSNFAPRLGFAYRISPRLVVRAGYAISYGAFDSVAYGGTLGTNYPFLYEISSPSTVAQTPDALSNGQTATIENTFAAINMSNPALVTGAGLSLYGKQYDYKTPSTESANLTVQDQFTNRDSIQVGFVASLGRDIDEEGTQNSPTEILPNGTSETSYLPFPQFTPNTELLANFGVSNYTSLQTIYQHQFKDNLVLLANYTYAKCMDEESGFRNAEWLPGFGPGQAYALCSVDAKQLVHASGEYALPFGRGQQFMSKSNRLTDAFVGGWHLNYIFTYQSGEPFTVTCPTATTSDFGCNANLVPGENPYAGPHNQKQWLNPSAFAEPPAATTIGQTDFSPLGSAGYQVRGPGFYNLDSSIFKNFATGEGTTLQFRLETFNTFNNPQFNTTPGQLNFTNLTNFSEITSERGTPRLGQLALKLFF